MKYGGTPYLSGIGGGKASANTLEIISPTLLSQLSLPSKNAEKMQICQSFLCWSTFMVTRPWRLIPFDLRH